MNPLSLRFRFRKAERRRGALKYSFPTVLFVLYSALITQPKIILADEPTGALDSKTSVEVMQLLKKLNAEEHKTIIVVTHESGVANETNKIVHIKDGIIENIEENFDHHASPFGINGVMK